MECLVQFNSSKRGGIMKHTDKQLLNKLKGFGLKPNDWFLAKKVNNQIKIQNKKDESFSFIGQSIIKNGVADWKSIHLSSL